MRRSTPWFRLASVALAAPLLLPTPVSAHPHGRAAIQAVPTAVAVTEQVIVTWRDRPTPMEAGAADRLAGIRAAVGGNPRLVRLGHGGAAIYSLGRPLGGSAAARLAALRRMAGVVSVEPDAVLTTAELPDDTYASEMWGLLDGAPDRSPFGVDAVGAWARATGSGVVVAVVDTGLVAHPDLAGQTVAGYDFISDPTTANDGNGRDGDPADPGDWVTQGMCGSGTPARASSWHGTHVAGTIAALPNNALGVFGGAPDVDLQPIRVLGRCGGMLSDVADAIRWAAGGTVSGARTNATPARVINLSLSGQSSCSSYLQNAITMARNSGAVVVAAAGNAGGEAANYSPANCAGVVTVAATDADGKRAFFSNYDSAAGGGIVDLAAPGVEVLSTVDAGTTGPAGAAYASYNGTSMAAPHVSLSAALVLSRAPALTVAEVESLLRVSSTPFGTDTDPTGCSAARHCGDGIVSAARAVAAAAGEGAPSAPSGVRASPGNAQALVWWNAPASPGSSPLTGYTVTAVPGGATCTTDGALQCTVTGLANGTAHTFTVVAANAFGTSAPATASAPVTPAPVDSTPPVVSAPVAVLATGLQLDAIKVPLVLSWSAFDASGVSAFELQQSRNGGSWTAIALPSATAIGVTIKRPPGSTYRFRLRARDGASNTSGWAMTATAKLLARQESHSAIGYSGTWTRVSSSTAYGGALRYAKASTARATMSFTGSSVAWVATTAPLRGLADVYIDGVLAATVDLYSAGASPRRVVFAQSWSTSAKHTIQIRVKGTRGRPRVDLDTLIFLK